MKRRKALVMSKRNQDQSFCGSKLRFFNDISADLTRRRSAFNPIMTNFYKKGATVRLLHPCRLRIKKDEQVYFFNTVDEAQAFYNLHYSGE